MPDPHVCLGLVDGNRGNRKQTEQQSALEGNQQRAEGDGQHRRGMTSKRRNGLAVGQVPNARGVVAATTTASFKETIRVSRRVIFFGL
jgi:hypothetical protein